jgi:hypothetical protein
LNWSGQRLEGTERLYLLAEVPGLLVGGGRDSIIPVEHTQWLLTTCCQLIIATSTPARLPMSRTVTCSKLRSANATRAA